MSEKDPKPEPLKKENSEEEELHDLQIQLAHSLIENDEKNQFWKMIERIGNALSKKIRGWRRF